MHSLWPHWVQIPASCGSLEHYLVIVSMQQAGVHLNKALKVQRYPAVKGMEKSSHSSLGYGHLLSSIWQHKLVYWVLYSESGKLHDSTLTSTHGTYFCHSYPNRATGTALCQSLPVWSSRRITVHNLLRRVCCSRLSSNHLLIASTFSSHIASHCLFSRIQSAWHNPRPSWYVIHTVELL